jgi:methionyl aminopeptidase
LIILKSEEQINQIEENGKILRSAINLVLEKVKIGMSTYDLDQMIEEYILSQGATPTFKGYSGGHPTPFPAASCISPNSALVHGIPNKKITIKDGDLISIDMGVTKNKYIADSCISFGIGNISAKHLGLLKAAKELTMYGISLLKPGLRVHDIGRAISAKAHQMGFDIVKGLYAHGVGESLHEEPSIPHDAGPYTVMNHRLTENMVVTIEPVVIFPSGKDIELDKDGWTLLTKDKTWSAQFEHTIAITKDGHKILTGTFPEKLVY